MKKICLNIDSDKRIRIFPTKKEHFLPNSFCEVVYHSGNIDRYINMLKYYSLINLTVDNYLLEPLDDKSTEATNVCLLDVSLKDYIGGNIFSNGDVAFDLKKLVMIKPKELHFNSGLEVFASNIITNQNFYPIGLITEMWKSISKSKDKESSSHLKDWELEL